MSCASRPPFILNGEQRKVLHEDPGKNSHSSLCRDIIPVVNLDSFHSVAGRTALKDVSAQIFLFQFCNAFLGPLSHAVRVINVCAGGDEARIFGIADQSKGFPGNPKAAFNFRTDRNVNYILP